MDLSDPTTPDTSLELNDISNRRKSGRARQKPILLSQDPTLTLASNGNGAKRKRTDLHGGDLTDGGDVLKDEESDEDESDPDEEELKERRKKASKKAATKPATKKSKMSAPSTTRLAVRPAFNGAKKAPRAQKSRARPTGLAAEGGTGLYPEVFAPNSELNDVAEKWIQQWDNHQTKAMCDLINFVIKCTGCSLEVNIHDIEDPDNAVSKLTDLQEEYQRREPADYPLIAKAKAMASFRSTMTGFVGSLIHTCHTTGHLYTDLNIIENIEIWVSTMSSSSIRPFRHTATVISLTIGNAMCEVAAEIAETNAKTLRQKEGEQKKTPVNKKRVKELSDKIADWDRKYAQVKESLQAIFDTVFVHRYRDVDPKIRVDCVAALGNWIITLPDVFFEGIYLRYLGWVLSDLFAPTRAEVIKQLTKMFRDKDNVARLRTFTERFRPRLVEIAMRDSDVSIRASTVELLDLIRETELLEPDDIDNIGRLVFDTEPRVRSAVAGFFAENIKDLYETTLEDFGGEEGLTEVLGEEVGHDYDAPRSSWLTLKCIAESLQMYDAEDDDEESSRDEVDAVHGGADSRFRLASQTVFEGIPEAKDWKVLAGYLLHDFSTTAQASVSADTPFQERCRPNDKEEIFLLELLNVAVKGTLLDAVSGVVDKKGKPSKKRKDESQDAQDKTALHLSKVIPKLLKKFGSSSGTASAVLRLGSTINLDIFQKHRQESTTYAALLDDINKQFLSHADQDVLTEATAALLHAREFDTLTEVTESKAQELWDETIKTLRSLMIQGVGANISGIRNTVKRIAYLAGVEDRVGDFEAEGRPNPKKKNAAHAASASPLVLLLDLIREPELDQDAGEEAAEILTHAMRAILLYYMWTTLAIKADVDAERRRKELPDFSTYANAFTNLADAWPATSTVRFVACSTVLDLYTLFAQFRHHTLTGGHSIPHVPAFSQKVIVRTHGALEKSLAKITNKALEQASDKDNAASDDEEPPETDDEDEDGASQKHKQRQTLLAEKSLCELTSKIVLAIIGRVLDHEGSGKGEIRKRLQLNRTKLGSNYKEVIAYLDGPKVKGGKKKAPAKKATPSKSEAVVRDDNNEDDDEVGEVEEGGEEDLRNRELIDDGVVDLEDNEDEGDEAEGGAEVEDEILGD